jgi:hypothetical protein
MKLSKLFVIASLAGTLAVIGCGSDDSSSNGGNGNGNGTDPSAFCNENLCATSGAAKTECEEAVAICLEIPNEAQRDECVGTAVLASCKV